MTDERERKMVQDSVGTLYIPEDTRITLDPLTIEEADALEQVISWVKHAEAGYWWYPAALDPILAKLQRELASDAID